MVVESGEVRVRYKVNLRCSDATRIVTPSASHSLVTGSITQVRILFPSSAHMAHL